MQLQRADGHWVFELEADATHPGRIHPARAFPRRDRRRRSSASIAVYLRACQGEHGGWPLFHGGDSRHQRHRQGLLRAEADRRRSARRRTCARAREAILAHGGAARCNVFTRITLALFGQVPWRGGAGDAGRDHAAAALVPVPPRQGVLLVAHRDRAAAGPDGAEAAGAATRAASASRELFVDAARRRSGLASPTRPARRWGELFLAARHASLRLVEPRLPKRAARSGDPRRRRLRHRAAERRGRAGRASSRRWPTRVMAFDALGYAARPSRSRDRQARRSTSCW